MYNNHFFVLDCDCDEHGSENITSCDKQTGQCLCKMNYVGRRCDRCLVNYKL